MEFEGLEERQVLRPDLKEGKEVFVEIEKGQVPIVEGFEQEIHRIRTAEDKQRVQEGVHRCFTWIWYFLMHGMKVLKLIKYSGNYYGFENFMKNLSD